MTSHHRDTLEVRLSPGGAYVASPHKNTRGIRTTSGNGAESCMVVCFCLKTMPVNCCMVGCTTRSDICPALTFFRIKRKNEQWQKALVAAVNRADSGFNVKNMYICSRHFDESCLARDPGELALFLHQLFVNGVPWTQWRRVGLRHPEAKANIWAPSQPRRPQVTLFRKLKSKK